MLELFDSITEKHPNPNLISVMRNANVKELGSRGFTDVGYILLEEFSHRGHAVNIKSYTSLVEGFVKDRKFTKAVSITDQLLENNITLNTSIYQLVVPSLFKFKGA